MYQGCGFEELDAGLLQTWADGVLSTDHWTFVRPVGRGASEPWEVDNEHGVRAIIKSAELVLATQTVWAGAHEKIAADLARAAGVCVPPVTLWCDPATQRRYSISMKAFGQYEHWSPAREIGLLNSTLERALYPQLSSGYVFHNWIGDADHHGEDLNLVLSMTDAAAERPAIAFIDHGRSLSYRWRKEGSEIDRLQARYYVDPGNLPQADLKAAVKKVVDLPGDNLRGLVDRVPDEFLPRPMVGIICTGLERRRAWLAEYFGVASG